MRYCQDLAEIFEVHALANRTTVHTISVEEKIGLDNVYTPGVLQNMCFAQLDKKFSRFPAKLLADVQVH